jgi:Zn-dependent protease
VTTGPTGETPADGQPDPGRTPARRWRGAGIVIARPFGIPVYVSPSWFVLAALLVVLYGNSLESGVATGAQRYLVAGVFVVLLYLSVLVHELSHCVVARAFRLQVDRVVLYPLGGFSEISTEPATPGPYFLVAAAGPALSIGLAGLGFLLARIVSPGLARELIDQLYVANLIVGLFNLLPGLPLDGGRMLRAAIWKITRNPDTSTIVAAWGGRVIAIAIAAYAIFGSAAGQGSVLSYSRLWLLFISAFLWMQSSQVIAGARLRARLPALTARTLARRAIPVPAELPLSEAIRRADEASARAMVIVDHEQSPTAIVSETAVSATPEQRRPWVQAGSVARALDPGLILPADLSGLDLIAAIRRTPASEYLLIEPNGKIFGVLATADLDVAFART